MVSFEDFNREFDQFKGQLKSYVLRMTASVHDTEDLLQETWIRANDKLDTFRGESSLKTWIFAIGSNLTIDFLRKQKRWPETVTDICREAALSDPAALAKTMEVINTSPYAQFEIKEHIAFCFTCIAKSLPINQHLCLLLKDIHEFKISEIAIILQTTEALVKYHLHSARSKMIDIFEGRCALINKEGICHQCSEINGIFNPKQNTQEELVKIKLVKEAQKASKQRLFELRMEVLKGIDPYKSPAHELQLHHLEYNRKVMEKYLEKKD
ncbi:MAG: RNA polymerase sigma factor [Bacteroidota bacterium]